MRITLKVDSATPHEVYNLTLAFQRTRSFGLPPQVVTEPTVTVAGVAMGWTTPGLYADHARAVLAEYDRLVGNERFREETQRDLDMTTDTEEAAHYAGVLGHLTADLEG